MWEEARKVSVAPIGSRAVSGKEQIKKKQIIDTKLYKEGRGWKTFRKALKKSNARRMLNEIKYQTYVDIEDITRWQELLDLSKEVTSFEVKEESEKITIKNYDAIIEYFPKDSSWKIFEKFYSSMEEKNGFDPDED